MAAATARQHKRVIVVGAGVMGSAAAHALVSSVGRAAGGGAQCTVTLLEQHEFGHKHGSSHGHSRIIRPVYSQQHYASLMPEAYARWSALDAEASDTLYTQTGGLYWGPVGFVDGSGDSMDSHRATCDALGVEYEMMSRAEVAKRWPPLDTPASDEWEGLFNPDCGILHADACVAALQTAAAAGGAELHERCTVTEIEGGGEGDPVSVRTADGREFQGDHCVVCAGPWAGELLRRTTGLQMALQPTQNTVAYWPAEAGRGEAFEAGQFPVLISDCELGTTFTFIHASFKPFKFSRQIRTFVWHVAALNFIQASHAAIVIDWWVLLGAGHQVHSMAFHQLLRMRRARGSLIVMGANERNNLN
jgi:glycine/D-amino acid oxidase-like deaminating enzyme